MFKFVTILFATIYIVCVALWTMANYKVFGFDQVGVPLSVLNPLGWPWNGWFREQLNTFTAPLVTFAVLLLATYLVKRDQRGMAR